MSKHYIRLNEKNRITKAFSDAFESPLQTDICICEEGERHFNLDIYREDGLLKYKYDNDIVVIPDNDYTIELQILTKEQEIENYKQLLVEQDYKTDRHYEQKHIMNLEGTIDNPKYDNGLSLDNGEILAVFKLKQTYRNAINQLEIEIVELQAQL